MLLWPYCFLPRQVVYNCFVQLWGVFPSWHWHLFSFLITQCSLHCSSRTVKCLSFSKSSDDTFPKTCMLLSQTTLVSWLGLLTLGEEFQWRRRSPSLWSHWMQPFCFVPLVLWWRGWCVFFDNVYTAGCLMDQPIWQLFIIVSLLMLSPEFLHTGQEQKFLNRLHIFHLCWLLFISIIFFVLLFVLLSSNHCLFL